MIICGTGHRPHLCNNFGLAKKGLKLFLDSQPSVDYIISGMADGWDTILAKAAIYYKIPLHCYIPYKGQKPTSENYQSILERADNIVCCSDKYFDGVFLERDRQMVDASNLVLAFWNPEIKNGGTFYTVKYAINKNVPVINFFNSKQVL